MPAKARIKMTDKFEDKIDKEEVIRILVDPLTRPLEFSVFECVDGDYILYDSDDVVFDMTEDKTPRLVLTHNDLIEMPYEYDREYGDEAKGNFIRDLLK